MAYFEIIRDRTVSPGYCVPDDCVVDAIGLRAIANYDTAGRQESESAETHFSRWYEFILSQENATTDRRLAMHRYREGPFPRSRSVPDRRAKKKRT